MGSALKTIRSRRGWVFLLAIALAACGMRSLAAQDAATGGNGPGAHDPGARNFDAHSFDARNFDAIDALMQAAVAKGSMPGGVVIIGHNGAVVYRKAFGSRSLEPAHEAMTADTIFDLASLTKVIATTTAVMQLLDEGRIRLNEPVAAYLPEFAQNGKGQITVRELLTHFSGLPPDLDLKDAWQGRDTAYNMAMQARPMFPPGTRFLYSDINFEVLGFIVEKIAAERVHKRPCLCDLGHDGDDVSSARQLDSAHRTHAIRREREDVARRGARSHGAKDGRSGGARGIVLDGGRSGKVCAGTAER